MPDQAILRERHGTIEVVTINRPDQRNAINVEVAQGMAAALDDLEASEEVSVVIITGSGDKAFCAGMDLKAFSAGEMPAISAVSGGFAGITERAFSKPLIAAVNGAALAGGFEVMLSCDLVVASEHAVFGIPEVKRGLFAAKGGVVRLAKRIPMAVALEMALTGDVIDAQRALSLGLINRVVPKDQALAVALQLAAVIAENAPFALRTSKRLIRTSADSSETEAWKLNDAATEIVFNSPDAKEGALAFAEKRPAIWTGRER